MTQSAEFDSRETKLAELKRLITAEHYESLEKLEDAVDALLWSEHDRLQEGQSLEALIGRATAEGHLELARSHPK